MRARADHARISASGGATPVDSRSWRSAARKLGQSASSSADGGRARVVLESEAESCLLLRFGRHKSAGECRGLLMDERVVHEEEGLRGDGRGRPVRRGRVGIGAVEEGEEGVPFEPLGHEVDAPPVRLVDGGEGAVLRETPGLDGETGAGRRAWCRASPR